MAELPAGNITIFGRHPYGNGRFMVWGRVTSVDTTGGHVPAATLQLRSIDCAILGAPEGTSLSLNRVVPNSQSATDNGAFPGDLFITSGSGTVTVRFLAIGRRR